MKTLLFVCFLLSVAYSKFYTQVVLPDTQYYSGWFPLLFDEQASWAVTCKGPLNVDFISHVGDIVDNGNDPNMWLNAVHSFDIIQKSGIHYGIAPGNHDISNYFDYVNYNYYFGKFITNDWTFTNPDFPENNYQLLERDGDKFIVINYAYLHTHAVVHWIEEVLTNHSDRYAIMNSHSILWDCLNIVVDTEIEAVIHNHCNVVLAINGHFAICSGENRFMETNACGNSVFYVVQDYQGRSNGGDSWLRYYTFEKKNLWNVCVYTYNVKNSIYEVDDNSYFSFNLTQGSFGPGCGDFKTCDVGQVSSSFPIITLFFMFYIFCCLCFV